MRIASFVIVFSASFLAATFLVATEVEADASSWSPDKAIANGLRLWLAPDPVCLSALNAVRLAEARLGIL